VELNTALTEGTGLSFFNPLVETRGMEFVHAQDFSDSLSFIDRVVANSTVFVEIVTGEVGHESDFISFGVLLVEEVQVSITENKVERKIQ